MAYGKKYELRFKNRKQQDIYRVELWEKDFVGDVTQLKGAETPFTVEWNEQDLLEPIQAATFTISFLNDGLGIEDFYSDDDQRFRMDFYFESDANGDGDEKLLNTGYLVQDGASEPVTDRQHYITLKATDNLGLLKNVKWNETNPGYESSTALGTYIRYCLNETGLYNFLEVIEMSLPLRVYSNLFENTTDDRSDDILNDPFEEIVLYPNIFKSDDNTWSDCYEVLTTILNCMNAVLVQADGAWNVIRRPEYKLFAGEIPGTQYEFAGSEAVTLPPALAIARNGTFYPVEEDQTKTIQRPLRLVRNTFTYEHPEYINQNDLQLPEGATPYDTDTIGDFRYDKYDIPTYFPSWIQRGTVTSYLEVVTNISRTPETEEDRYVVIIGDDSLTGGVQFNPIPVTQGDKLNFSLRWRTDTDTDDLIRFWVRFVLISTVDTDYNLSDLVGSGPSPDFRYEWVGPSVGADLWDTGLGMYDELTNPNDIDTTEWRDWSLSQRIFTDDEIPIIPADGMLLIEVRGPNAGSQTDRQNVYFKDIQLDFQNYINDSTLITGHVHTDTGTSTIKAIQENSIEMDDSPRNVIAGTLFTDATTNFDYTDINTGQDSDVGNIFFTKTFTWHRGEEVEELRLGNIITQERLQLQYTSRLMIEGTFRTLRDNETNVSIINLFTIGWLTDRHFLFSGLTIDYMNCTFSGRMIEVFKYYEDDFTDEYQFNYLYEKQE